MALNSLEVDPLRVWKGPWRWYADEMLDCCRSLEDIRKNGITLSEFSCLARCNGLDVKTFRADVTPLEQFEADLKATCSSQNQVMVVSYARKVLNQTGDGHFSPIGAYYAAQKMALVMDVARFKYPAYWVPLDMLYRSLHPRDPVTHEPRGYSLLRKKTVAASSLTQLTISKSGWKQIVKCWESTPYSKITPCPNDDLTGFWSGLFDCYRKVALATERAPEEDIALIAKRVVIMQEDESKPPIKFGCTSETESVGVEFRTQFDLLVAGLQSTRLYNVVKGLSKGDSSLPLGAFGFELAALFFLSIPYRALFSGVWPETLISAAEAIVKEDLTSSKASLLTNGCRASACGCADASSDKALSVLCSEVAYLTDQFSNLSRCVIEEAHGSV
ncbi:hypothetical protein DSO57_1024999 [Entomophthora muscae]|nr:hypothetical protein DSO57_1024999 [Entomophthora muscae]